MKTYLAIMSMFGSLSLLSIGGGNAVLPEMHLQAVSGHHWLTNSPVRRHLLDLPGRTRAEHPDRGAGRLRGRPGVAGVAGGIIGGVIATVAMVVPAAILMYLVTLSWQKAQKSKLRRAVEKGFAPLTVGLIMATSLVMSRAADHDWRAYLITGIATVIFVRTDTNP